jgi:hypothetical protein
MRTITDIKQALIDINNESKEFKKDAAERAFELFKGIVEIDEVFNDLENFQNGDYSFDDSGMLVYSVEVPKEIADLPFINDYLTQDYQHLIGYGHNDLRLAQTCGDFISINTSGDSRSYFVYDSESGKELVKSSDIKKEGHPTISENQYIAAKIELHQLESGCFNDVVLVDYHGSYVKHFNTHEYLRGEVTKDMLNDIIDTYETEEEN